jgi:hypothetical protein
LSRLNPGRGSSPPTSSPRSAPTTAGRGPRVLVQSPKSDIYVALLGVALGAIVISVILMIVLWSRYDFKTKVSAASPAPRAVALA